MLAWPERMYIGDRTTERKEVQTTELDTRLLGLLGILGSGIDECEDAAGFALRRGRPINRQRHTCMGLLFLCYIRTILLQAFGD